MPLNCRNGLRSCVPPFVTTIKSAKIIGLTTIAFTRIEAEISNLVDIAIEVPSLNTQHIQECHMVAYHVITEIVEESLFGGN